MADGPRWPLGKPLPNADVLLGDLESPYALKHAAEAVARTVVNDDTGLTMRELVMLATGPDATSVDMTLNAMASLDTVGLGQHILLLADSAETCGKFHGYPCYWSSRVLRVAPSDSVTMQKFWDWRFRFYYVKKAYLSQLVSYGFSAIQADTDTVWNHDPFPALRSIPSSLITMADRGICNAGMVYARPGSRQTRDIIDEVAWRVQLFQHYPETVAKLVHYAKPPYYVSLHIYIIYIYTYIYVYISRIHQQHFI